MASAPTMARCRTSRAGAAATITRRKPRCAAGWDTQHGCPHGSVVVDGSGNLCIADADNQRVREVNTSGTMSTVAGNGTVGYSGARPVVVLDGSGVGVMSVGGGFA